MTESKQTKDDHDEAKVVLKTKDQARQGLRQKVLAVSRVMKFYRTLQQSQDDIIKLKQLSPNRKLPNGVLAGGKEAIKAALKTFDEAKRIDAESEMYPNSPAVTRSSTMFSLLKESDQELFLKELNADFEVRGDEEEDPLALAETPSISILDSMEREDLDMVREPSEGLKSLVGASRKLVNR